MKIIVVDRDQSNLLTRDIAGRMRLIAHLDEVDQYKNIDAIKMSPVKVHLKDGCTPVCQPTTAVFHFPQETKSRMN